jgi:hypothetical protein
VAARIFRKLTQLRGRDYSRLSCGVANMQLRQGFPQMFPARMSAHHRDGLFLIQVACMIGMGKDAADESGRNDSPSPELSWYRKEKAAPSARQ